MLGEGSGGLDFSGGRSGPQGSKSYEDWCFGREINNTAKETETRVVCHYTNIAKSSNLHCTLYTVTERALHMGKNARRNCQHHKHDLCF